MDNRTAEQGHMQSPLRVERINEHPSPEGNLTLLLDQLFPARTGLGRGRQCGVFLFMCVHVCTHARWTGSCFSKHGESWNVSLESNIYLA